MKITFLIQDLFQQGAQYVTALMIRGFISKGYSVDLIVAKVHEDLLNEGSMQPFEIPKQTNIIILKDKKARNNISEIRSYLKTTDSKAVIAMSSNYTTALSIAAFGLRKKPIIAFVEHSGIVGLNRETLEEISAPSLFSRSYWISKFITSQYDVVMAVSSGTARNLERVNHLPRGTANVVYNPAIDNVFFQKLALEAKHPWLKSKTIPTLISAGAHSKIKNHLMLFEAIKYVNDTRPVRLILFGNGTLTDEYLEWIKDNKMEDKISLANHTNQLPAELKESDGLIISSNMESFSLVLVEALAANIPVISTNCPYGPSELLEKGKYGTLVPVNDSSVMAQAILKQITKPRIHIPKEAWEKYTLERVVNAYEKALNL